MLNRTHHLMTSSTDLVTPTQDDKSVEYNNPLESITVKELETHTLKLAEIAFQYLQEGQIHESIVIYQEIATHYGRYRPISRTVANCYKNMASALSKPGDQQDISLALNYLKKAANIYLQLIKQSYSNTRIELYGSLYYCYSNISYIYYQMGEAYESELGTPYDYELRLYAANKALQPDQLYFEKNQDVIKYYFLKNNQIAAGLLSSEFSFPFSLEALNFHKNEILHATAKSKDNPTRSYDQIDAEYALKIKEKATRYNASILFKYILEFGILHPQTAACCRLLSDSARTLKQTKVAEYHLENAKCIDDLLRMPQNYLNYYASMLQKNYQKNKRNRSENSQISLEANTLLRFMELFTDNFKLVSRCCAGIGSIYYFILQHEYAIEFFTLAAKLVAPSTRTLSHKWEREYILFIQKAMDTQQSIRAPQSSKPPQKTRPSTSFFKRKNKKPTILVEEKKSSLFTGHRVFSKMPINPYWASFRKYPAPKKQTAPVAAMTESFGRQLKINGA